MRDGVSAKPRRKPRSTHNPIRKLGRGFRAAGIPRRARRRALDSHALAPARRSAPRRARGERSSVRRCARGFRPMGTDDLTQDVKCERIKALSQADFTVFAHAKWVEREAGRGRLGLHHLSRVLRSLLQVPRGLHVCARLWASGPLCRRAVVVCRRLCASTSASHTARARADSGPYRARRRAAWRRWPVGSPPPGVQKVASLRVARSGVRWWRRAVFVVPRGALTRGTACAVALAAARGING